MNNFDDILEVKATVQTPTVQSPKPQWQEKQQQNREYVYQTSDAAIEEFTRGEANIRKYLDVQSRLLDYVNQIYIGKEPHKITADLTEIKETAKAIDTRMTRALEQNRSAKVKTEAR